MIHSKQKFTNYSKYEIRCKIPKGTFFPAFWAIGGNSEIDVFDWSVNHGEILGGHGIDIVYVPDTWGKFTLETFAFGPNGEELTVSKDFYVEKCKEKSRKLVVFPNPSSDHIQIRLKEDLDIIPWANNKKYFYRIVKLNSSMDVVRVGDYFANKTIKTNNLPNGSYMIEIEIDNTPINTTFSISH